MNTPMDIQQADREVCGEIWSNTEMIELLKFITQLGNRYAGSSTERLEK